MLLRRALRQTETFSAAPRDPSLMPASSDSHEEENTCAPWLESITDQEYSSAEARLHDEVMAYVNYMTETPEEEVVVKYVVNRVCEVLRRPFRNCQVHVFGSTATGLRLPGSDIDLVIETTDMFNSKDMLFKLSDIVKSNAWCQGPVSVNYRARVPIITFSTTPEFGSLKFDVGINNTNGLETGAFVAKCLRTMPALRPLVLVMKKALSLHGLNDASKAGISSFAVICMCIFFLQVNPYGLSEEYFVDPIGTRSLGFILYDFLAYYSRGIPYRDMYISVSQGRLISKDKAHWIGSDSRNCLVIQCPCDPERNITRALSLKNFDRIRRIFTRAHEVIGSSTAISWNILGALVFVNEKFIEHRKRIQQLAHSDFFAGFHGVQVGKGGGKASWTGNIPALQSSPLVGPPVRYGPSHFPSDPIPTESRPLEKRISEPINRQERNDHPSKERKRNRHRPK